VNKAGSQPQFNAVDAKRPYEKKSISSVLSLLKEQVHQSSPLDISKAAKESTKFKRSDASSTTKEQRG